MKALADRGYVVIREGSRHTFIGKLGKRGEPVPRHDEIMKLTESLCVESQRTSG
jgi:hypothetical protein